MSLLFRLVGVPGFEPGTPCSQSRCANRTALHPESLRYFKDTFLFHLVGVPGFEPGTPCSQSRCANRTALHPEDVKFLAEKSFTLSGYQDSNLGPPAPKAGALTGLRYTPKAFFVQKYMFIFKQAIVCTIFFQKKCFVVLNRMTKHFV